MATAIGRLMTTLLYGISATDPAVFVAMAALFVVVALIGILVTLPLMVVIAILVKLTSRGPVLYRQARVGLDRRSPRRPCGNLRRFADAGGLLFSDDCNHDVNGLYAKTFEQEMTIVFPDDPMAKLPASHPLYRSFFTFKGGPPQTSHAVS